MSARHRSLIDKTLYYCVEIVSIPPTKTNINNTPLQCYHEALQPHFNAIVDANRVLRYAPKSAIISYVEKSLARAYPEATFRTRETVRFINEEIKFDGLKTRMRIYNNHLAQIYTSTGSRKLRRMLFRGDVKINFKNRPKNICPAVVHLAGSDEDAVEKLQLECRVPFEMVRVATPSPDKVLCPDVDDEDEEDDV